MVRYLRGYGYVGGGGNVTGAMGVGGWVILPSCEAMLEVDAQEEREFCSPREGEQRGEEVMMGC